ncbi:MULTISPECIES: hypothetical protein [unclassified Leucobacter]|uniref:hypothetical protein n=1 Tax=unclassified Leucobacter TaxID=2621730 RepID=UPI003015905C
MSEQQPVYSPPAYTPPPRPHSAFAGLPGTVLTAGILWGVAGLLALIGPIASVVKANNESRLAAQAYMQADPITGQLYGNMDRVVGQMQAPWFGAVIFAGLIGLIGYVLVTIFVLRGSNVARLIATILSGMSIFLLLAMLILGVLPLLQILLTAAGAVLIWLPAPNAFFAAKRAAKPRPVYYQQPVPAQYPAPPASQGQ